MTAGIICQRCYKPAIRTGNVQKYCRPCSEIMAQNRKNAFAREHRPSPAQNAMYAKRAKDNTQAAGRKISEQARSSMGDMFREVDLEWMVMVRMPFMQAASKNHIHAITNRGHLVLRQESKDYRDALILNLKSALGGRRLVNNKVWLDIFVQKPHHKGDAVNMVDLICDAVKVAVGVDDRWFSLRRVDWEIVKENPEVFIGVGQEKVEHAIACSSCGRILPLAAFNKNATNMYGVTRNCKDCRTGRPLAADGDLLDADPP